MGGTRLGTSTYNFGAGIGVTENLHLGGNFETHSALGNSWETFITYSFDRAKPKDDPPGFGDEPLPDAKPATAEDRLEQWAIEMDDAASQISDLMNEADRKYRNAKSHVDVAKRPGTTRETITAQLGSAAQPLQEMKTLLEQALIPAATIVSNEEEGRIVYTKAFREGTTNRSTNESWSEIQDIAKYANNPVNNLIRSYQQIQKEIALLKSNSGMEPDNVAALVSGKNVDQLENYFQRQLSASLGIPDDMMPVEVTSEGTALQLTYRYPHSDPDFVLADGVSASRFVADHVIEQVKKLRSKGVQVGKITVLARMQARKSILEGSTLHTHYRESHFGPAVKVNYKLVDEASKTIQSESARVESGKINLLQLACLKMHGLKTYMTTKGISTPGTPIALELSAPNYDQSQPQVYNIVVEIR